MSRKLLVFLIYGLLILVVQEALFRLLFQVPSVQNFDRNVFSTKEGQVIDAYTRNRSFYWESTLDTNIRFVHDYNTFGFRDLEWSIDKRIEVERIMFVGDSLRNDVQAPIAFGMQAVWFDRHAHGAPDGVTAFTEWEGFPLLN